MNTGRNTHNESQAQNISSEYKDSLKNNLWIYLYHVYQKFGFILHVSRELV